jgi:hypothetical protein
MKILTLWVSAGLRTVEPVLINLVTPTVSQYLKAGCHCHLRQVNYTLTKNRVQNLIS